MFLKEFFKTVDFEKMTKKHAKLPSMQRVKMTLEIAKAVLSGHCQFDMGVDPAKGLLNFTSILMYRNAI